MVVAIDQGNKQYKTAHSVYTSGFTATSTKPGFGSDILKYDGQYYMLSQTRRGYQRNKTLSEDCFILTLFGIAKELVANGVRPGMQTTIPITLLVGLPPAHYGSQFRAFRNYFLNRGTVTLELDGQEYKIRIDDCECYVQGFAAMLTVFQQVKNLNKAIICDCGGFTLDYLPVTKGRPDVASCDSLEMGVIKMYNRIIQRCNGEYDILIDEEQIDAVLKDQQSDLSGGMKKLIKSEAEGYIDSIVSALRERAIDLRSVRPIFVGGGAMLLKPYILNNSRIGSAAIVVDDIGANAKGYEILYRQCHQSTD